MEHVVKETAALQQEFDFSIVSAKLTIEAMRDSGYKDTDHALAELIDNSVEARADLIEVVAVETPPDPNVPFARARVSEIAVIDNGEGMDATTLRRALKFGDGTRLDRSSRGIGRFGVGLPQSSISQCRRVDIWTWQNGATNAFHCYLDLDEIQKCGRQDVPEVRLQPVPERWLGLADNSNAPTGTIVIWSNLDRVRWSGGKKTLARTAELCGRIYRKFLTDDDRPISIALIHATDGPSTLVVKDRTDCLPNDPLYLMSPSATPEPFSDKPMFETFNARNWTISIGQERGEIHVRCTMARTDAINEAKSSVTWPYSYPKAGSAPWGKHADRNKGVSIVRARRELELSLAWVNNYEPEERWWSVEVEFDPILDEVFGVVNNKQHAHAFVAGAGMGWEELKEDDESFGAFRERLENNSDPRAHLLDVWVWIDDQIKRMRKERKKITKGTGTPRHPQTDEEIEDVATKVINEQKERGEEGDSDRAPATTQEEKISRIVESARQVRVDENTAKEWAEATVRTDRRVLLKSVTLGHRDAFFDIESVNDVIEVWLNEQHPVHEHLIDVVTMERDDESLEELNERLRKAAFTFRMLLVAWARNEDKAPSGNKGTLEDVRMDWGREARKFLEVIES
ncbi:MAG: ATP-binding protein [Rhodobacteraceae bacterium]|nr:ATP-binding protein [Paracoccaceae bacterium]